jgi:hypothetical protein
MNLTGTIGGRLSATSLTPFVRCKIRTGKGRDVKVIGQVRRRQVLHRPVCAVSCWTRNSTDFGGQGGKGHHEQRYLQQKFVSSRGQLGLC